MGLVAPAGSQSSAILVGAAIARDGASTVNRDVAWHVARSTLCSHRPRSSDYASNTPGGGTDMYQLYGKTNSGAAAIEAALELCDVPYRFIDVEASAEATQALEKLNPLQQIPTLQTPSGDVLTESAAILIHLGLTFPAARLLPSDARERGQAIRGMTYIVTICYAAIGIVDYPERWLAEADESSRENL